MVILGVGVRRVNARCRPATFPFKLVGDRIEVTDFVTGRPTQIPLAGPANRQGRLEADATAGHTASYRGTQGTSVVGVFDYPEAA